MKVWKGTTYNQYRITWSAGNPAWSGGTPGVCSSRCRIPHWRDIYGSGLQSAGPDVRQFLINNALYYISEFHVDGFRYDEISDLISMNCDSGWTFCRDLTDTLRFVKPRLVQNAEFWPGEVGNYPKSWQLIVAPTDSGGAGFDVVQHDGLRSAVRNA